MWSVQAARTSPVDNRDFSPVRPHSPSPLHKRLRSVFPVIHTPYDYDKGISYMMETPEEAVVTGGTLNTVCSRDELLHALGIVSRGVSTRTTVQILSGILLEAGAGTLRLAATDMEVSLRTS